MRKTGAIRLVLAAIMVVVSLAVALPASSAYPREENAGCYLNSINMILGSNWPAARRAEVIEGFQKWNSMKDQNGNQIWNNGPGNTHVVQRVNLPEGDAGKTLCGGAFQDSTYFQFDTGLSGDHLIGVAAHEAGHAHGLNHSGKLDNNTLKPPYMATCLATTTEQELRGWKPAGRDDYGAQFENETNGVSANQSFENGKAAWGSFDSYSVESSGGSEGPNFGRLANQAGTNRVYSWVRQEEPNTAYDARINYRVFGNTTAFVRLKLMVRRIDFAANSSSCDWPNIYGQDLNYNEPTARSGFWPAREITLQVQPNSGWDYSETNDWFGALNNQWQGADLKVQISVWAAEGNVVDFDNTRVRTQ